MPRKGYKPTGYRIQEPAPETLLGVHKKGWKLFAESANCPLYCKVRIIAPGLLEGSRRASFHLGWKIQAQDWARISDYPNMPLAVLDWAKPLIIDVYPSVEEATGMTREEVQEIVNEQNSKRKAYERRREQLARLL
jgi:hypothetical protein